jgi:hypothetical protein
MKSNENSLVHKKLTVAKDKLEQIGGGFYGECAKDLQGA